MKLTTGRTLTKLEDAIRAHITFTSIKEYYRSASPSANDDDNLRGAVARGLADNGVTTESLGIVISVYLNCRRYGLRQLYAPGVRSFEEALPWRKRLLEARAAGWPGVRQLWLESLR